MRYIYTFLIMFGFWILIAFLTALLAEKNLDASLGIFGGVTMAFGLILIVDQCLLLNGRRRLRRHRSWAPEEDGP